MCVTLINLYNQIWLLKIVSYHVIVKSLSWFICTSINTETKILRHVVFINPEYQLCFLLYSISNWISNYKNIR
jgi:hypothetical protein